MMSGRVTLYDASGRAVPLPPMGEEPLSSASGVRSMWSSDPSRGLTPETLTSILEEADQGDPYRQSELFEEVEEKWGHLGSVLQTRRLAVAGKPWEVLPAEELGAKGIEHADFARAALRGIKGFRAALLSLCDAIGKGYSATEIVWAVRDGVAGVEALKWRHPKGFSFDAEGTIQRRLPGWGQGAPLTPWKYLVFRPSLRAGLGARGGQIRVASWAYLFWTHLWKFRMQHLELYGSPTMLLKYPRGAGERNVALAEQALELLASAARATVPDDFKLELQEASKTTGGDVYEVAIEGCERWASKAVLGQTLTTEQGSNGSRALGTVHNTVRQDLLESDGEELSELLTFDLVQPLVLFRFGPQTAYPRFQLLTQPDEDALMLADRDEKLSKFMPLPLEYLYRRHRIPAPKEGEQTVGTPLPASAGTPIAGGTPEDPENATKALLEQTDAVVDHAMDVAVPATETITAGLSALKEAGSFEAALAAFEDVLGKVDPRALEKVLARTILVSNMVGELSAWQEAHPGEAFAALQPRELQIVPFEEARQAFAKRVPVTATEWKTLNDAARTRAFATVNSLTLEASQGVHASLQAALREGKTYHEWADEVDDLFPRLGISSRGPHHVRTVIQNAAGNAAMAGRYRQQTRPEALTRRPYWMYDAVGDGRTRPTHRAMDGQVWPADHPIWQKWYPPNGHRCRCNVQALSLAELKSRGLELADDPPEMIDVEGRQVPLVPDPGWAAVPSACSACGGIAAGWTLDTSRYPRGWVEALHADEEYSWAFHRYDSDELSVSELLQGELVDVWPLLMGQRGNRVEATAELLRFVGWSRAVRARGAWRADVKGQWAEAQAARQTGSGPELADYLAGVRADLGYLARVMSASMSEAAWAAYGLRDADRMQRDLVLMKLSVVAPPEGVLSVRREKLAQRVRALEAE